VRLAVVCVIVAAARVAHAQSWAAPAPAPVPTPLEDARDRDAATDRAFAYSTAIALPSGDFEASLRFAPFGAMLGAAVGFGGSAEAYVDAAAVPQQAGMSGYGIGVKLVILRGATSALAIDSSYHKMADSNCSNCSNDTWQAGLKASVCAGASCRGLMTFGVDVLAQAHQTTDRIFTPNASVLFRIGGAWKALVEGALMTSSSGALALGFAGLRIGNRKVAFDAGVGFGQGTDGSSGATPLFGLSLRP
jgi:hypothetical protein